MRKYRTIGLALALLISNGIYIYVTHRQQVEIRELFKAEHELFVANERLEAADQRLKQDCEGSSHERGSLLQ